MGLDDSMSYSQQSQWMRENLPPGQGNSVNTSEIRVDRFREARKDFNDKLTIDNNLKDSDDGVNKGLMALDDASYKAVSKLL